MPWGRMPAGPSAGAEDRRRSELENGRQGRKRDTVFMRLSPIGYWPGVLALALAIGIFATGLFLPLGIAAGIPYIAVILLASWSGWRHGVYSFAAATSVLTVIGYFASPGYAAEPWVAITNRILTLLAIWTAAVLVQRRTNAEAALRQSQQDLNQIVERRTAELAEANRHLRAEILRTQETEGELRASEDRYRQLVGNVPSVIYQRVLRSDGSTYYPFVNDAVRSVYGVEPAEVTSGRITLRDLLHSEDRDRIEMDGARAARALQPWTLEARIVTKAGQMKWVQGSARPRRLPNGDIVWDGVITDITERKQAEDELRRSEERYAMAVRGANDGLWDWDVDHRTVYRSPRVLELFDLDPAQTDTGEDWWLEQIHPDDRADYRHAIVAHLKGITEYYECEYRIRARSGRYLWAQDRGSAQRHTDGHAYRMAGSIRNITGRRAVLDALKQSEERFRALSDLAPTSVLITRRTDGKILYANNASARILGVTPDLPVTTILSLYDDPAERTKVLESLQQRGRIENHELRFRRPDGRIIWIALNAEPIEFDGVPAVFGAAIDITDRKLAEDALREREIRLRGIMDNVQEGILTVSTDGIVRSANAAAARILGYEIGGLVGIDSARLLPEPHASRLTCYIDSYLGSGQGGSIGRGLREAVGLRKDGTEVAIEQSISPMNLHPGEPPVFIALFRDISDRKRADAERAAIQAKMRETEKLRALGTLAGGIAHDINNTLVPMLNLTELTIGDLPAGSEPRGNLEIAFAAGQRVRDMTRQILAFSRREEAQEGVLDFGVTVRDALNLSRTAIPPNIVLRLDFPSDSLPIVGDVTGIHQMVMNLVSNAVDAMADGGTLAVGIRVAGGKNGSMHAADAELTVSDTGPGMDAETLKRAFEPFYTTKPVGRGTGLGLSIVHSIAARHSGTISVDSVPGRGTTFFIRLPLAGRTAPGSLKLEPATAGLQ